MNEDFIKTITMRNKVDRLCVQQIESMIFNNQFYFYEITDDGKGKLEVTNHFYDREVLEKELLIRKLKCL